jgi:uncharacterized membrane-anchored protein
MTLPRLGIVLALAVVAAAQTGVLAYMVIDRVLLLKNGREITLSVVPVDPRDLFRGEYVRLGYTVSTVPVKLLDGPQPDRNAPFYVVIEKQADGSWRPIKVQTTLPAAETSPDRVVLKARTRWGWPRSEANVLVRYGIESYFVPEGQGRRLEDLAREKKLAVRVAVDGRGNAAIKGLLIDGVLQYEDPLL